MIWNAFKAHIWPINEKIHHVYRKIKTRKGMLVSLVNCMQTVYLEVVFVMQSYTSQLL